MLSLFKTKAILKKNFKIMLIVNKNILSTLSRLEGTESVRALNADINADISITVTAMTTNSRLF